MNAVIWWLADPLFVVDGNERRVEQLSRQVLLELKSSLNRDERFDWRPATGGDARAELVTRYGWPAYLYWPGYGFDIAQSIHLAEDRGGAHSIIGPGGITRWYKIPGPLNEPVSTYEYPRDRIHLVPSWRAIARPYSSESDDWVLNDPASMPPPTASFRGIGDRRIPGVRQRPADSTMIAAMTWWPQEHAPLPYALVHISDGQVALLRRDAGTLVAVATDLPALTIRRPPHSRVGATLVAMSDTKSREFLQHRASVVDSPLVMRGILKAPAAVMGVEFPADTRGPGGRNRFGVTAPPTLSSLGGRVAVSDPVVLRGGGSAAWVAHPDSALERMATTLQVDSGGRVELYWETYGISPDDTADISVWIERYTPQGLMRRLAIAFRLAENVNTPVAIQWRESEARQFAHVVQGSVPIVARTVVLDVARLPKGDYWVDVAVGRPRQEAARGRRGIAIR